MSGGQDYQKQKGVTEMIETIMKNGFGALSGYLFVFAVATLALYVVSAIANAFMRSARIDTNEIRKLFMTNLTFTTIFALLDYFLV